MGSDGLEPGLQQNEKGGRVTRARSGRVDLGVPNGRSPLVYDAVVEPGAPGPDVFNVLQEQRGEGGHCMAEKERTVNSNVPASGRR